MGGFTRNEILETLKNIECYKVIKKNSWCSLDMPCVLTHSDRYNKWNYTQYFGVLRTHFKNLHIHSKCTSSISSLLFHCYCSQYNVVLNGNSASHTLKPDGKFAWGAIISWIERINKPWLMWFSLFCLPWVIINRRRLCGLNIYIRIATMTATNELKYWNSFIQLNIAHERSDDGFYRAIQS